MSVTWMVHIFRKKNGRLGYIAMDMRYCCFTGQQLFFEIISEVCVNVLSTSKLAIFRQTISQFYYLKKQFQVRIGLYMIFQDDVFTMAQLYICQLREPGGTNVCRPFRKSIGQGRP